MINLSALVNDLGPSQKSFYLIKEFNNLSRDPNLSCTAFVLNITAPVTQPLFSCSSVSFFSDYSGTCIATTLEEADILLKSNNNCDKYLYLWDIEWIKTPMNYSQACDILLDERLKIISRSLTHSAMIKNFCNRDPVNIVEDWNSSQLLNILEKSYA
tara:strand:+ start:12634 stop:13104 length:471 start_codon:yes stop_codon:yes gene_type:complete